MSWEDNGKYWGLIFLQSACNNQLISYSSLDYNDIIDQSLTKKNQNPMKKNLPFPHTYLWLQLL